jgi:hypothetical protein
MHQLQEFLSAVTLGSPVSADGLTVYPLFRSSAPAPFYDTLSEAVRAKTLHISEVSDTGRVPELRVVNDGKRPVLIIDGEELIGAKQNRIVNLTVLVPERSALTLPVTCVEAGRWATVSREFEPAERAHYASGRRSKLGDVSRSMHAHGEAFADQAAVWSAIAEKSLRFGAKSPTSAAAALYEQRRDGLDKILASIKPLDGQVGAVFAIRGAIAGFDAFDSPATWASVMPKLLRSYGLDAMDTTIGGDGFATPDPQRFLKAVSGAVCTVYRAVGAGHDLRFEGGGIIGAALEANNSVVHAVAFPEADVTRPTSRRRWWGTQ